MCPGASTHRAPLLQQVLRAGIGRWIESRKTGLELSGSAKQDVLLPGWILWVDGAGWVGNQLEISSFQVCSSLALKWAEYCSQLHVLHSSFSCWGQREKVGRGSGPHNHVPLELQNLYLDKELRGRTWKYTGFILSYLIIFFSLTNKHSLLHVNTNISFNKLPAEIWNSCVSPESHIIWIIPASDRHLGKKVVCE